MTNKYLPLDRSHKKRWRKKKNGYERSDICSGCGWINCDNLHGFMRTPYVRKVDYRKSKKLCIGCGHKPCTCKNKKRPIGKQ